MLQDWFKCWWCRNECWSCSLRIIKVLQKCLFQSNVNDQSFWNYDRLFCCICCIHGVIDILFVEFIHYQYSSLEIELLIFHQFYIIYIFSYWLIVLGWGISSSNFLNHPSRIIFKILTSFYLLYIYCPLHQYYTNLFIYNKIIQYNRTFLVLC